MIRGFESGPMWPEDVIRQTQDFIGAPDEPPVVDVQGMTEVEYRNWLDGHIDAMRSSE